MAAGILNIVATPIGNLEDITLRALRILKEADCVFCEDTRMTKRLLDHYEIKTPTASYHQHSDDIKIGKIIALLRDGKNLALVSDAGTPGISDPGGKLISLVRAELGDAVRIAVIPGVSALAAAVSGAGAGFDRFLFLGFLPHKKGRQTMLKEIAASGHPAVVYESKHRIIKLLSELAELDVALEVIVARELTKIYESFYFGTPDAVKAELEKDPNNLKGEFVVLINKKGKPAVKA